MGGPVGCIGIKRRGWSSDQKLFHTLTTNIQSLVNYPYIVQIVRTDETFLSRHINVFNEYYGRHPFTIHVISLCVCLAAHLLPVLAPAAVQALDDAGGVPEDEGEAGGARDHGHHRQPEVRHVLGREPAIPGLISSLVYLK